MDTLKVLILLLFCSIASAQVTPSIPNNSFLCNTAGLQAAPGPCTLGTNLAFSGSVLNAGGGAFNAISSGTNTTAAMLVGTGGSLGTSGSGTLSANQINGTSLSGLATGILKNTTTTGVPSIATSADVIADFTGTCNSTTFLRADGSCQSAGSAAFNAITTGTNTAALTMGTAGVLTTSGTGIINADQVNGATVPASAALLASNSSGQETAVALGSSVVITGGVLNATAPNRTVTTSPTVLSSDMGGQINSNVSGGGTLTIPAISSTVFSAGATLTVVNYSASTEAVSTTPTINSGGGCVSGTGIPAGDTWQLISNGTTIDCSQTGTSGGAFYGSTFYATGGVGGQFINVFGNSGPVNTGIFSLTGNDLGLSANGVAVEKYGATPVTITGCGTAGTIRGHGTTGTFVVGTGAATCTFVFTINGATGLLSVNGWVMNVDDVTAKIHCPNNGTIASSTTGTVICNSTVTTGDLITFHADTF